MESGWMGWLKENMPADLFAQMRAESRWAVQWREDVIKELKQNKKNLPLLQDKNIYSHIRLQYRLCKQESNLEKS